MISTVVHVKNSDRIMTNARVDRTGIAVTFADERRGHVPFADIPELGGPDNLASLELPNPYEIVLNPHSGEAIELSWDFVRHYCDPGFRSIKEARGAHGREALGRRIRQLRKRAGMTQNDLARAGDFGRVTLARIEKGEQSPRFDTLQSIARGLRCPVEDLRVDD